MHRRDTHPMARVAAAIVSAAMLVNVCGCALFMRPQAETVDVNLIETYVEDGRKAQFAGDLDTALVQFEKALEVNSNYVDAHLGIGDIYQIKGDYEQAASKYATARRLEPGNFDANYKLGLMHHLLNRINMAVDTYLAALTINPDSFEANLNIATAYFQLNQPAVGLPYAERAIELNPDSQAAFVNLGSIYSALDRHEDAVQAYRSAADRGDLSPPVAINLINALVKTRGYQRAINTAQVLVQTDPQPQYYERMGYCHFKLAQYYESMAAYDKAVQMDPNFTAALNGLGVTQMALYIANERRDTVMRDSAMVAWRRSVRIDQNQPQIIDLIARFGGL